MKSRIKQSNSLNTGNYNILGTYEGETMDTTITNKNGLDITDDVMQKVFESEDYQQGIENGWFIGYLGHPEDPNCMEFERGCIVMTEGHIESNGKVYGKFNLIDTPVGQIVKKFQDAGVKFGISIRGAGDIYNNSVDPDTFVFRGFDLVSFPAYPESIPTFTSIAASTDVATRKKYQAVCAAVKANCSKINDCDTLDIIQEQFAPQSEEYKLIEDRKSDLLNNVDGTTNMDAERVEALTTLYVNACEKIRHLTECTESLKQKHSADTYAQNMKFSKLKRLAETQAADAISGIEKITASYNAQIQANKNLRNQLKSVNSENLIYQQKIESSVDKLRKKDKVIASLQTELHETIMGNSKIRTNTSNLDEKNRNLKSEITACRNLLQSYQDAYASLYANALGVDLDSISISANTTVDELQKCINSATNTCNIPSTAIVEPMYVADESSEDEIITI